MRGRVARIVGTAVLGVVIGFFVAVSGFADGPPGERAIVIGVILLAYALAGLGLGFRASVWYGLGLAVPGLVVFPLCGADRGGAMTGAYGGVRLGMRRMPGGAAVGTL